MFSERDHLAGAAGFTGNKLPPLKPKFSTKFEQTVFKAPIGKVSGPIQSPFGWHIVFIHDRKDRRERSFEKVQNKIHKQLKDKRLRRAKSTLIKELRAKGDIQKFIEL